MGVEKWAEKQKYFVQHCSLYISIGHAELRELRSIQSKHGETCKFSTCKNFVKINAREVGVVLFVFQTLPLLYLDWSLKNNATTSRNLSLTMAMNKPL
ncbi:hypothetical protein DPMN_123367 [Dreissena polymorpha]|uniref:Uncharacterized protein n=1 Tax=Dreissena polymorpha TaxID=45954 RepID=A0A9D4JVA6_DREPO|nr:hypothetical protein DPMN_123367 [Dreissena polymorpha]